MSSTPRLFLPDDLIVQIGGYARNCLPLEACGLVVGTEYHSKAFLPVSNELQSPSAFRMDPQEQLNAFLWMEKQHLDLLAIFHSHPQGPQTPSATDIAEFFYPGVASLIWTPASLRAFDITCEGYFEIQVILNEASNG
jgi:proteasome lid subunit RPN8/RPN11